ncbi:MAG: Mur ligase domain-containing protein, partial [Alphaproteobacteria bacterium]
MLLSKLIASEKTLKFEGADIAITGMTADSRQIKPGFLFVAIPGTTADGRSFIPDAIKNGAVAILAPTGTEVKGASLLTTPDIRKSLSKIAATFYTKQPQTITAVTGTSGKTSTAQYVREMWQSMGHKSASIGTLGYVTEKEARYGSLTTPDAITLHHLLEESAQDGITHL